MPSVLPIHSVLPQIEQALKTSDVILEAPPGAGKTTQVPLACLQQPEFKTQKILVLEPRRLAAKSVAVYMAQQLGEQVGQTVGYRIRLESKVSQQTRVEIITYGVYLRLLQNDPSLDGVGLVMFDEFHERSLDADLSLALTLQGRELFREIGELKILIMSATLSGIDVQRVLPEAKTISSLGRSFPVDVTYGEPWKPGQDYLPAVVRCIQQALVEHQGDILVFLPGQSEIFKTQQRLQEWVDSSPTSALPDQLNILPLYGDLPLPQQQTAIAPSIKGQRKIVLSSALAESSLTIEGVTVVVDAGLSRQAVFDSGKGMTQLQTRRLSRAASEQRKGRAGRTAPGVCYRLWSETQQDQLLPQSPSDIQQADLSGLALQLLSWGVTPQELTWIDEPPTVGYDRALELLVTFRVVNDTGLTPLGELMVQLPAHPRLAYLMLQGALIGDVNLACDLAALLGERDPYRGKIADADIMSRLEVLQQQRAFDQHSAFDKKTLQRIEKQSQSYRQLLKNLTEEISVLRSQVPESLLGVIQQQDQCSITGYLLACAYPDRIAKLHSAKDGVYRLSQGRQAKWVAQHALWGEAWIVAVHLGSSAQHAVDRIYLAAPFEFDWFERSGSTLNERVEEETSADWDDQTQRWQARRIQTFGKLILSERPLEASQVSQEVKNQALKHWIQQKGLDVLPWNDESQQWVARVNLFMNLSAVKKQFDRYDEWPDFDKASLLACMDEWLIPHIEHIQHLKEISNVSLLELLKNRLTWDQQQTIEAWLPSHFRVPSGARLRIDYCQSPPVLAVKLQEMFGCLETPSVANGQVVLSLHLLSPAHRPLQVTQDILGFWKTSYIEVKKEMKGRYPKHPWPDDPLTAQPSALTKNRLANANSSREKNKRPK